MRLHCGRSLASATGAAVADSSVTPQRKVTKVAEGIYSIRHADAPDTNPQGNTTVIIGERGVLVVDSAYLPSSAAEDIAQIRRWTDRPVRYVLNTHWHPDHQRGNSVYVDAFSEVVPGHGDVMHDKSYIRAVLEMVETIVAQVNAAVVRIGSLSARLEDVRPQIDVTEYRRRFAGDDPHNQEYFDESIEGLIKDAFHQAPK